MNVFEQALLNTLMGMGTVFAVLIFISLLISLFVYIPSIERALKNRSSKKEKKAAQEERPAPKRPILEEVVEEEELVDDGELVAVITAAIMASPPASRYAGWLRNQSGIARTSPPYRPL